MESHTTFVITNDLKVIFRNFQLETKIYVVNKDGQYAYFDVDKWTEFKKSITDIDSEFYRRFNSQFTNT